MQGFKTAQIVLDDVTVGLTSQDESEIGTGHQHRPFRIFRLPAQFLFAVTIFAKAALLAT